MFFFRNLCVKNICSKRLSPLLDSSLWLVFVYLWHVYQNKKQLEIISLSTVCFVLLNFLYPFPVGAWILCLLVKAGLQFGERRNLISDLTESKCTISVWKKGGNVISFRINVKCFVLALLHTGQMLESYVIIGWRFFFFLIAPILGPFLSPFFKTKAFWKEKPNFQTQKFCFFLWHFHHEALCLWLHWNAMFWHFAVWMSG